MNLGTEPETIFITGVTGTVGREVLRQLLAMGASVRASGRASSKPAFLGSVDYRASPSLAFGKSIRVKNLFAMPQGDGAVSVVDVRDVAAVAALNPYPPDWGCGYAD